ncbi:MAG: rRNA maturation RNase YbeY [Tepidisphaeraceae bacterium]
MVSRPPYILPLRLDIHAPVGGRYVSALRRQILAAHALLRSPLKELSLAIVPRRQMALLHKKFLHRSGPTDVLSFELDHDPRGRVASGEIIICHTIAHERARSLGHRVAHELLLYALHGLLHLSGFDDRTQSAFTMMHAKEDEILTGLGVGPVFCKRSS